jgi:hypothetical protein
VGCAAGVRVAVCGEVTGEGGGQGRGQEKGSKGGKADPFDFLKRINKGPTTSFDVRAAEHAEEGKRAEGRAPREREGRRIGGATCFFLSLATCPNDGGKNNPDSARRMLCV